jgi:hypothetical protein
VPRLLRPVPSAVRGALLSVVLLLAACGGGPVTLERPPAEYRGTCARLAERLPEELADLAAVAYSPDDAYGGAWGDPPLTLTCGVPSPEGFGPASSCLVVNGVDWFAPEDQTADNDADLTLTTATLTPRVALHVPASRRGATLAAALVDLAAPLKATLTPGTRCQ